MTSQPNANVRRHNSLPNSVRRSTPALQRMSQQMKFNPYVGWFRHSPETSTNAATATSRKQQRLATTTTLSSSSSLFFATKTMPASPYLGYLRYHDSPTMAMFRLVEAEFLNWLKLMNTTFPAMKFTCDHVQELADFLAGRLRGGSPSWYYKECDTSKNNAQHHHHLSKKPLSKDARLLKRIAGWILAPFLEDEEEEHHHHHNSKQGYHSSSSSSLKSLDNESLTTVEDDDENELDHTTPSLDKEDDEDDSDSSSSEEDNDGSTDHQHNIEEEEEHIDRRYERSNSVESSSSAMQGAVSSQAEAYYAHQAARDLNPDEVIPSRLDYVITQMDIIRMQRNASRHLDVDSIYQLPTITYLKQHKPLSTFEDENNKDDKQQKKNATKPTSEGWSWMLVSRAATSEKGKNKSPNEDEELTTTENEEDVCVICLEHYVYGDRLRVLPCNHSFHIGCIDRWLSGSASFDNCHTAGCPTCKKRPVLDGPEKEEQGDDGNDVDDRELRQDGSVPSWAFSQLGSALLERDSKPV